MSHRFVNQPYSKGYPDDKKQNPWSLCNCTRIVIRGTLRDYVSVISIVLLCCLLFQLVISMDIHYRNIQDFLINQQIIAIDEGYLRSSASVFKRIDSQHRDLVTQGIEEMKSSDVSIIGVAKNVATKLPSVLSQINRLAQSFSFSQVIIVEGDSSDDTLRLLNEWKYMSPANRMIISHSSSNETDTYGKFSGLKLPREGRISNARNVALQALRSSRSTKYVIVIDLDILGWDHWGIVSGFGRLDWDIQCSHGVLLHGVYRDTYAFRRTGIDTNHHTCGQDFRDYNISHEEQKLNREHLTASQKAVHQLMSSLEAYSSRSDKLPNHFASDNHSTHGKPRSDGLLRVDSCFGGLALYRRELFDVCGYHFRYPHPPYMLDCEHVVLHKCLAGKLKDLRILANVDMKLWYGHNPFTQHNIKKFVKSLLPF